MTRYLGVPLAILMLELCTAAQQGEILEARLSPVAMDAAMRANITGAGSARAVLTGSKLAISGSFSGLHTPATIAQIHQGSAVGVRGPAVFELNVPHAMEGAISGSFELKPEQIENLQKGKWYVQIDSEKAPEGNLWGWLLKPRGKEGAR